MQKSNFWTNYSKKLWNIVIVSNYFILAWNKTSLFGSGSDQSFEFSQIRIRNVVRSCDHLSFFRPEFKLSCLKFLQQWIACRALPCSTSKPARTGSSMRSRHHSPASPASTWSITLRNAAFMRTVSFKLLLNAAFRRIISFEWAHTVAFLRIISFDLAQNAAFLRIY